MLTMDAFGGAEGDDGGCFVGGAEGDDDGKTAAADIAVVRIAFEVVSKRIRNQPYTTGWSRWRRGR